jgi:hypothetical protein
MDPQWWNKVDTITTPDAQEAIHDLEGMGSVEGVNIRLTSIEEFLAQQARSSQTPQSGRASMDG